MESEVSSGVRMILKALEKDREQRHWEMWIARFPHMDKKTFVPFSQFYKPGATIEESGGLPRSKEEILADAEMILASLRKGGT